MSGFFLQILRFRYFILVLILSAVDFGWADVKPLRDVRIAEFMGRGEFAQAREKLQAELAETTDKAQRSLALMGIGITFHQEGQHGEAVRSFSQALTENELYEDLKRYYLALSYEKINDLMAAKAELVKVLALKPNQKLRYDAIFHLGRIEMSLKRYPMASQHFRYLAKRVRGQPEYPGTLWELTRAELLSGRRWQSCRSARLLYTKFPDYEPIADWGFDLHKAKIDQVKLGCVATPQDQQKRIRRLQQLGKNQQARAELDVLKKRAAASTKYFVDSLYARFLIAEGSPREALNLLLPYYREQRRNFEYLMLFSMVAARAGEFQAAVGAYYEAHRLSPRSRKGKQALYQAAFLSYQFQDYDGAQRKFQEFRKKYPTSGLSRDTYWHSAWIRYLKGDYPGAAAAFEDMLKASRRNSRRWKSYPTERIRYWIAMAQMRMGNVERAQSIFSELAAGSFTEYYAILAGYRLEKMGVAIPVNRWAQKVPQLTLPETGANEKTTESAAASPPSENEESEETIAAEVAGEGEITEDEEKEKSADSSNAVAEGEGEGKNGGAEAQANQGEEEEVVMTSFQDPRLAERFARAQIAMSLGLTELAKWELYEIERRTSNRGYLKALMESYVRTGSYHRAAYIGQVYFATQRQRQGIAGARSLWEWTYPRAFEASVKRSAESFAVPLQLVWGIMRAESSYRPDVVSPVGAMGLMQVMPTTGQQLANLLNEKDFAVAKLNQPDYNVRLGTRYLMRLMRKFDQRVPLVAASYNAGPHRVDNWLVAFGGLDMDEFIEHIPFLETRNYVKKVVSNYETYGKIYGFKELRLAHLTQSVGYSNKQELATRESWAEIE